MKWKKALTWAMTVFISFSVGYITAYPETDVTSQIDDKVVESETIKLKRPKIENISSDVWGISLNWNSIKNADHYSIYRGTERDSFVWKHDTYDDSYKDTDVEVGQRYYYKVQAISRDESFKSSRLSKWRSAKIEWEPIPQYNVWNEEDSYRDYVEETVYVTNTGSKYHRYGCQYLSQSCIAIDLSDAEAQGYTACSRCW